MQLDLFGGPSCLISTTDLRAPAAVRAGLSADVAEIPVFARDGARRNASGARIAKSPNQRPMIAQRLGMASQPATTALSAVFGRESGSVGIPTATALSLYPSASLLDRSERAYWLAVRPLLGRVRTAALRRWA